MKTTLSLVFSNCITQLAIILYSVSFAFGGRIDNSGLYNGTPAKQIVNLFDSVGPTHKPGSGTALYFNGRNSYAALPSAVLSNATKFTIEYWIKTTENRSCADSIFWQRPTMIGNETVGSPSGDFGITTDNGRVGMWAGLNLGGDIVLLTDKKINDGTWHHIAAINNGNRIILYVDGINFDVRRIATGRNVITSTRSLYIGASNSFAKNGAAFYHQGEYDEVRIWDEPLSMQEIRDRMCHKISPSDSLYSHLVAYYNFDEDQTDTAFDIANHNDGILKHWPPHWQSGAPIGDASVNAYMYGGETKSLSIAAASGETFQVTTYLGQSRGLHLYVVNENPADTNRVNLLCAQNKYFGIFSIGKGNPFYSGTYNYSSNKCVTATNESKLRIYERPYQGLNNWYQLPYYPNLTANTITILRIHRYNARFILGLDINAISNETNLIKNTAELMNITLSPNPVSSLLHVHLNTIIKESGAVTIKIIDQNDKEIWKSVNPQNDLVIDVHAFAQGVYFIQFMSQQGVVTKKFIVNR